MTRGSNTAFVSLLNKMWDAWIDELEAQELMEQVSMIEQ